jgi:small GTP-binding protein
MLLASAREQHLKVILAGPHNAGKTAYLNLFSAHGESRLLQPTVGADFICQDITFNDIVYRVHIWDTAGQEVYHSITGPYFRNAAGVLLFFDVSERTSFQALDYWFNLIEENTREMPLVNVLGNKCDLHERQTSIGEAVAYCQTKRVPYFEVSAKTGFNADLALHSLIENIVEKQYAVQMPSGSWLPPRQAPEQDSCC